MHDYIKQVHIKEIPSKTLTVDTKFESAKKIILKQINGNTWKKFKNNLYHGPEQFEWISEQRSVVPGYIHQLNKQSRNSSN